MRRKTAAYLLAGVMTMSALAGCQTAFAESGDNVLHYQVNVAIDSMDPQYANDGTSFSVLAQCMEGLYTKDESGSPVMAMAENVEKSDDGLTITVTLRDDACWSNGDPVTADDFVFAWQHLSDPELASDYQFFVETLGLKNASAVMAGEMEPEELGVYAEDDKTLVLELDVPCAIFESLMTFPSFYPVNRSFYESCGGNFATSADTILCNGAFKITEYEPAGTTITAEKNETYYDADSVSLDGVEWQVILDSQTAMLAMESGTLDVVCLTGELIEQYEADSRFTTVQEGYQWYISPNLEDEALGNWNIREALAKSFDKESITGIILKDGSPISNAVVPVDLAVSPDGTEFRSEVGDYDAFVYDVEAAQEYWAAGLEELGVDSLELDLVCEDSDSAQNVAQFLQSEWMTNLPGLTVTLTVEPKKARLEDMREGNYQLGLTRWGPDYADPMTYLDMYLSDSTTNYGNWSNEEYDELITSAKYGDLTSDLSARWDAMIQAEGLLADDVVIFPIYQQANAFLISENVSGITFYSTGFNYLLKNVVKG